uniref:Apple domain-containing protein n=1 Tax=Steinernema glaseri TaxID=37863 RepID=A0A1I8ARG8_9BILA
METNKGLSSGERHSFTESNGWVCKVEECTERCKEDWITNAPYFDILCRGRSPPWIWGWDGWRTEFSIRDQLKNSLSVAGIVAC